MSAIDELQPQTPGERSAGAASLRRFDFGRVVSSLRHRNYRLYFFGQLVSVMGTWMQTVAQSFLVLDLTHSGTALGLVTAVRFVPILLFGPAGGLFADRRNKRRILYVTQTLCGVLAAIFAILTGTHLIQMWSVYLLALSLGMVNVFDNPARQSFISEMVPPEDLPNAVTLNSVSMNLARVFGAAVGGVLAAVLGLALCFTCNALSYGAVLLSLAAMSGALLYPAKPVKKMPGQIRAGLRYVRDTPELLIPLLMKGGMDLPPALTVFSQALMALLFGFLGLMCAVPVLAATVVAVRMIYVEGVVRDRAGQMPPPITDSGPPPAAAAG